MIGIVCLEWCVEKFFEIDFVFWSERYDCFVMFVKGKGEEGIGIRVRYLIFLL